MGDPEPAVVGEFPDGLAFGGQLITQGGVLEPPAGRNEILEYLLAVRQVHEGLPVLVGEIAVAELHQPRVLLAARPASGFLGPSLFLERVVAVVRSEDERRAWPADTIKLPQRRPPVLPSGNLHQSVEEEERAIELVT